jgi:hypothetical protein
MIITGLLFYFLPPLLDNGRGPVQGERLATLSDEFNGGLGAAWQVLGNESGTIRGEGGKVVMIPDDNSTLCGDGRGPAICTDIVGDLHGHRWRFHGHRARHGAQPIDAHAISATTF